jgi:DNA-binding transcriptional LysR family regulator
MTLCVSFMTRQMARQRLWRMRKRALTNRVRCGNRPKGRRAIDLDLDLAASFLTLVDEWHYGRAAQTLYVSTSALTKRIQRLERHLGVDLVERGSDSAFGLTAAGLEFASAARPLLAQARAAAQTARAQPSRNTLRIGVPAGTSSVMPRADMLDVERSLRRAFPPVRIAFVEYPFQLVSRCLPDRQVDVLLTVAPVRHRDVESFPLPITSARIGAVSARHPLADACEVDVAQFCEHALLYNPDVPVEWMRPFWLEDIRSRREARLVTTHASHNDRVLRDTQAGALAIVTLEFERAVLPPGLQAVSLVGAPPVTLYAARRRSDRRDVVHRYIDLVRALGPGRPTGVPPAG